MPSLKPRTITLASLLTVALVALPMVQRTSREAASRFQEAEQGFMDFLVANAYDTFQRALPERSSEVVLVEFREEDKMEYSAWPPAPLDYIMLLKRVATQEPEVVAFAEPLRWDDPGTQFLSQLRQAMLPIPSLLLGFEISAASGEMTDEQKTFLAEQMPSYASKDGDAAAAPAFKRVSRVPDKILRVGADFGFSRLVSESEKKGKQPLPFVAFDGQHLAPSLAAQAVTRFRHMPFSALRLRFGSGARLNLGDEHVVPLDPSGSLQLKERPAIPRINALNLLTPDLDQTATDEINQALGKGKVVLVGMGEDGHKQAQAIALALAMPKLHRLPLWWDWVFAALVALACYKQWFYRRFKVLLAGVVLLALAMLVCLLTFQSALWWWSPLPAAVVILVTTLFCFVWPHRARSHGGSIPVVELPPATGPAA